MAISWPRASLPRTGSAGSEADDFDAAQPATNVEDQASEDALNGIFDAHREWLGNTYFAVALLTASGERIVGRQISCSRTRAALNALAKTAIVLDGLLGCRRERRAPSRIAPDDRLPADALAYSIEATENLVTRAFVDGVPCVTDDFYDLIRPTADAKEAAAAQRALGIEAIALLPLMVRAQSIGVLAIGFETRSQVSNPILAAIAGQIALTVENARLHHEMRHLEQQVSVLLKATIDAQEDERERICLEIHDGVAQMLAPAFQYLQTLDRAPELAEHLRPRIRKAEALVREAIRGAREVIGTLRPAALDALGLVATLRYEVDELGGQRGWRIEFDADQVRFSKAVETALYRILHEAITNVSKHAGASKITVRVKHQDGYVVASVQDDGVGFDLPVLERTQHRKGVGLLSMRKRAELLQGVFKVTSDRGQGTRVSVEVPISRIINNE